MNIYNFDVNFTTGRIYAPDFILVVNDHNSTLFKFTFDQTGRYVFKLLYPDGTVYVQDIADNQLKLTKGVLNQEGNYKFEISLYGEDNRLTTARIKEFPVRLELVSTDEPVQADDRLPILDNLIEETNKVVEAAKNGELDGATFTPSVSDNGDLSWTNDKGKENPPTVNIAGPPGAPGAVKMQVVDTLPDVGETDTIYLVKKNNPGEQNLYDEYVYTETSGWEHIGDTSVDLTDYYTKEEADKKIEGLYTLSIKSLDGSSPFTMQADEKIKMSNIINDAYQKGLRTIGLLLYTKDGNRSIFTNMWRTSLQSKPTTVKFLGLATTDGLNYKVTSLLFQADGAWTNDVFSCTGGTSWWTDEIRIASWSDVLTKTNSTSYTPTDNYNPATKKYVDDNKYTLPVASAETLGGIKLGEGLSADENGVVSASSSGLLNDTIRVIKLPNNLGFNPYFSGGLYKKITDSDFVENVNSILTDIYNLNRTKTPNNTIILFTMPSGYNNTYFGFTQAIGNNIPTSSGEQNFAFNIFIISCVQKTTNQALFGYDIYFQTYIENNQVRIDDERITKSYNVTVTPQTWASGAGNRAVYETDGKPLGILNTTEFTPTQDYHPSTKKYVDDLPKSYTGYDATKTQVLKNVNGTLTWVDEV